MIAQSEFSFPALRVHDVVAPSVLAVDIPITSQGGPLFKTCTKCKTEKPLDGFYSDGRRPKAKRAECRACVLESDRLRRQNPETRARRAESQRRWMKTPVGRAKKREALLRWRQSPENRAKMAERARLYKQNPMVRAKHAESMRRFRQTPDGRAKSVEIVRRWLQNPENRAKKLEYDRMRRQRPEVRASRAEYTRRRLKTDLKFRLATSLRSRLQKALKGTVKSARTLELLGCSVEHLIKHLESNFRPGMSWANRTEWHIDHIRPLASFDLTDPAQQRAACHWTNLQPLWADDNFRKHAKYETPSHPEGDTGKEVGANRTIAEPHSPGFFQNI